MHETRVRRFLWGLSGVALLAASFLVASPGGAQVPAGPSVVASLTYAEPGSGGPPDYIFADGMTPGEAVHLEVDFGDDGSIDFQDDGFADQDGKRSYDIGTSGLLLPGARVTLTGTDPEPDWQKDLLVQFVRVEFADPYSDAAAGMAPFGATVHLNVPIPGGGGYLVSQDVTADATGWWHYDFAAYGPTGFDLTAEHVVSVAVDDGDGDLSQHAENAQRPTVNATIGAGPGGYLLLNGWPESTPVTVAVDFQDDSIVDESINTFAHKFGPGIVLSGDNGQLQFGSRVTVTAANGTDPFRWEKVLVLEPLSVDGWSIDADWVEGTAPPERPLSVEIQANGPSPARVDTSSGTDGHWVADFAGSWDVQPGTGFIVRLPDEDDDTTGIQAFVSSTVTLNAWPTQGLWDGAPVNVFVGQMPPNRQAFLTMNVASDPFNQVFWFAGVPIGGDGSGQTTVNVPRFIGGFDCASAPGACILVTADPDQPFQRNASIPLSFGRLDLFEYELNDPQDPSAGGIVGDPITIDGEVGHDQWIWVEGTGFQPGQMVQLNQCKDVSVDLCRNTWQSSPFGMPDGDGWFGVPLQVGRNVFGVWGEQPQLTVEPTFDLRDGQTVVVSATGLGTGGWMGDCGPGECWIGGRVWNDDTTHYRSVPLTFSGDPVPITMYVAQALVQQMEAIVHIVPAVDAQREVTWDQYTGTLTYPYTVIQRWVEPDVTFGPYSPEPIEAGRYDCADSLEPDSGSGAQEPVHCALSLEVREGPAPFSTFLTWIDLQFARFDLTAAVTSAAVTTRPAGVTLRGEVTCTGFMPERYLVEIDGALTQLGGSTKRPITVTGSFALRTECSGTMANPGKASWSVFVPGTFKAGSASFELDVSSAGFTRSDDPVHLTGTVAITGGAKGKGR